MSSSAVDSTGLVETMRYVARQPILNQQGEVRAYELLFRAGPEASFRGDGDRATRTMLDNMLLFGLDKLTGDLPAFINCTTETLTERLVDTLPPHLAVLEILESVEPTPKLIKSCRMLKKAGFRLALDDFVWKPNLQPLLEIADYVKVDFTLSNKWDRYSLFGKVQGLDVKMLAEKIETQEEFRQAGHEGFTLFQGYYFCRPELLKSHKVPANRLSQFAILEMLHRTELDMRELAEKLKQDASITFRLLRLANSPLYAMRQDIRSIDTALLVVGEDAFRRIAMLAIASELGSDQPLELLRMAFVRGRFCELSSAILHLDPTEQYLLGLVSLFPAMLCTAMKKLTPTLPLRKSVKEALEGKKNVERALLFWIEFNENGDWESCDRLCADFNLDHQALIKNYADAVLWAEQALHAAL
jgi:c-di-GMP-related signal transduction protein